MYDAHLEIFRLPVVPGHDVAGLHLELQAQDIAGHGQDAGGRRRGHSVDDDGGHFVFV